VLVRGPEKALIRRGETIDDLIGTTEIPPWL
jgi:hypothetical protein